MSHDPLFLQVRKWALATFVTTLTALFLMLAAGANTPASADIGGDGGTGTGSGSCSYSGLQWRHVKSWSGVQRSGSPAGCYNSGDAADNAAAGECDQHAGDMLDIWYLSTPGGQWARWPSAGNSTASGSNVRGVIDGSSVSVPPGNTAEQVKTEAKSHVVAGNNIIVCVWGSSLPEPVQEVAHTRPDPEAPSCRYPKGRIQIPSDGLGTRTYYEKGDGSSLTKGSWLVVGEDIGNNATIRQKLGTHPDGKTKLRWQDGTTAAKSWAVSDFGALNQEPGACRVNVSVSFTDCTTPPYVQGSYTLNSVSDDRVTVTAAGTAMTAGQTRNAADASSVTITVSRIPAGYDVYINNTMRTSISYSFPTCNNTSTYASVTFTEPQPQYNCTTQTTTWTNGSYTKSQSTGVTWAESGATNGTAGQAVTLVATAPSGKTFPTTPSGATLNSARTQATWNKTWARPAYTGATGPCAPTNPQPTSETTYEYEYRTVSSQYCNTGSTGSTQQSTTTSQPYPFVWTTTIEPGGPRPGPTAFTPQPGVDEYTPLGKLFQQKAAQNTTPTSAEISAAVAQGNTVPHARADLTPDNRTALAEGAIMNVKEHTTYMLVRVTRTDYYDNPYTTCYMVYQQQVRSRPVTTTRTPNPTTYTVQSRSVTTTPSTSSYYTWSRFTRSRITRGTACGYENVPGQYKDGNDWTNSVGSCTYNGVSGKTKYNYGDYTAWSWAGAEQGSSCPPGGEFNDIRNCTYHAGSSGGTTYGAWQTDSTTATSCPTSTSTRQYQCTQNPTTYTTTVTYGAWSSWSNTGSSWTGPSSTTYGSPVYQGSTSDTNYQYSSQNMSGIWQTAANHCNAQGMTTAVGSDATRISNGVANSDHLSAAAVTPVYTNESNAIWGSLATNARGTSANGFFDKLCAYPGARSGAGGAAESYIFFRDNEFRPTQVDLFRPQSGGLVTDRGDTASRTILTRWAQGTPDPQALSGGSLRGRTQDGAQDVFANSEALPPVLKNWTTSEVGSGATWAILSGQHTQFQYAGTWASEDNKPTVYQVKWEYAPNVATTIPTRSIGFGPGGSRTYQTESVAVPIQGQVYGGHDVATTPAFPAQLAANTGSGVTTNTLDSTLIAGTQLDAQGGWTGDPTVFSSLYNMIEFRRAVGS